MERKLGYLLLSTDSTANIASSDLVFFFISVFTVRLDLFPCSCGQTVDAGDTLAEPIRLFVAGLNVAVAIGLFGFYPFQDFAEWSNRIG
jgi:hypothetical protein